MHEFDVPQFRDRYAGMSEASRGSLIATSICHYMKEQGMFFSKYAKYLAIGAGWARAELRVAKDLGIPYSKVRLLDRDPVIREHALWEHKFPSENYLQTGMFEYLENPAERDFSLITAVNVEYAFQNEYSMPKEEAVESFVRGVSGILLPYGIVHISPNTDYRRFQEIWEAHHFRRINETRYSSMHSDHIYINSV